MALSGRTGPRPRRRNSRGWRLRARGLLSRRAFGTAPGPSVGTPRTGRAVLSESRWHRLRTLRYVVPRPRCRAASVRTGSAPRGLVPAPAQSGAETGMSLAAFQAMLVRLVIDPDFRDKVAREGVAALPDGLSARERSRLVAVAVDPGLTVTRTLH